MIQSYFSVFYFSINLGSLVSMIITPILRSDVQCFGEDCYFLAFGLPAALMILSIILFLCGIKKYKRVDPTENIIVVVLKVSYIAFLTKIKRGFHKIEPKERYWIDYAKDQYPPQLLEDVKALYRVLFIFLPIPVFWTLFDQQVI
uniref:Solute carrier family 15 member 2 (Trinotate prediction) n=1 Tax=Henneguya salminicola TaxID=69463 RepID=A0A6G3MEB5_HENSL